MFEFNEFVSVASRPTAKSRKSTFDFNRLLNWRLLQGSHVFPGPDGGTCINEAAIVAAGYRYRRVQTVADVPASFSLPISNYAMGLNDCIGDDAVRQELLLSFVGRLAGSADTAEVETHRTALIIQRSVAALLPLALEAHGLRDDAKCCQSVTTVAKANHVVKTLVAALRNDGASGEARLGLIDALLHTAKAIEHYMLGEATHAAGVAAGIAWRLAHSLDKLDGTDRDASREVFFRAAAAILDEALKIGNKAEPVGARVVAARMAAAKREGAQLQRLEQDPVG